MKFFGGAKNPMHEPYQTYDKSNSRSHYFYIVVQIPLEEKSASIAKVTRNDKFYLKAIEVNNNLKNSCIKGKILFNDVVSILDFIETLKVCIFTLKEILRWQM